MAKFQTRFNAERYQQKAEVPPTSVSLHVTVIIFVHHKLWDDYNSLPKVVCCWYENVFALILRQVTL